MIVSRDGGSYREKTASLNNIRHRQPSGRQMPDGYSGPSDKEKTHQGPVQHPVLHLVADRGGRGEPCTGRAGPTGSLHE